jgi:hypothetical protein
LRIDHSGFSAENRKFFIFIIALNCVESALSYKKYMIIKVQNNTKQSDKIQNSQAAGKNLITRIEAQCGRDIFLGSPEI